MTLFGERLTVTPSPGLADGGRDSGQDNKISLINRSPAKNRSAFAKISRNLNIMVCGVPGAWCGGQVRTTSLNGAKRLAPAAA